MVIKLESDIFVTNISEDLDMSDYDTTLHPTICQMEVPQIRMMMVFNFLTIKTELLFQKQTLILMIIFIFHKD
jgi:hypothetical protein